MADSTTVVLVLGSEAELFEGPVAGGGDHRDGGVGGRAPVGVGSGAGAGDADGMGGWDAVGAVLGEAGVERLLRLLHAEKAATRVMLSLPAGEDGARAARRLKAWCEARAVERRYLAREQRKAGMRMLAACVGLLAVTLVASAVLVSETLFGAPGGLRTLASEALIIAGWVAMWRPLELLIFDPLVPLREARLLERVREVVVETRG